MLLYLMLIYGKFSGYLQFQLLNFYYQIVENLANIVIKTYTCLSI